MKRTYIGLFFLVGLGLVARSTFAADKFTFIYEKQEAKEKHRWSITDWLETRDKMRAQDLWLAMHMPSPYEFYLGADYRTGNLTSGPNYQGWNFTFAAYAYFFGVEIQREMPSTESRWLALVNFRPFGVYNQATNLTFQFGTKGENRASGDLWNLLAGANLTLYFAKPFGVTALFRHTFSSVTGVNGDNDRLEAGAFIDFKFVRVHADYFNENLTNDPTRSFKGVQIGTRLYF